ncbi:hypothetical protein [Mycolicibacterium sp. P9-22]|uniref:hypothetical protein n=1 Tax=Mycolicibacterium sp. P9-22 TaxID=2024613 RepID=UPI0011ED6872|nr:hypothetical protein [Mycolicibacterium sp. P9-22]
MHIIELAIAAAVWWSIRAQRCGGVVHLIEHGEREILGGYEPRGGAGQPADRSCRMAAGSMSTGTAGSAGTLCNSINDQPRAEFTSLPAGTASAVAFAGPWSEARWTHGRVPGPADIRAALTRNGSDDQVLCAAGGPHQGAFVVPLLERCWPSIKALTKQRYRTGTAAHTDVCASLGLSDDGGQGSVALAMIRSGCHPGTFAVKRGRT